MRNEKQTTNLKIYVFLRKMNFIIPSGIFCLFSLVEIGLGSKIDAKQLKKQARSKARRG